MLNMNVLNVCDIETELANAASHAIYPETRQWVLTVPRNYLLGSKIEPVDLRMNFRIYDPKNPGLDMPELSAIPAWAKTSLEKGETLHWFDPVQVKRRYFWKSLEHIVNWFNSWQITDTRLPRLSRINFGTATKASTLWMQDVSERLWDYVKDKPPVVKEYEKGFHWVELTTRLHFERESNLMKHCIYHGGYYEQAKQGIAAYYSLRDKNNNPHCTVETRINPKRKQSVIQCKGNSNHKPGPVYQPYIRRFFKDMDWEIVGDTHHID